MKDLIYKLLAVFYNYYSKGSDALIAYECAIFALISLCFFNLAMTLILIKQFIIVQAIRSEYFLFLFIALIVPLFYLFQKLFRKNVVKEYALKFKGASIIIPKLLVFLYVICSFLAFMFIGALFSPRV